VSTQKHHEVNHQGYIFLNNGLNVNFLAETAANLFLSNLSKLFTFLTFLNSQRNKKRERWKRGKRMRETGGDTMG